MKKLRVVCLVGVLALAGAVGFLLYTTAGQDVLLSRLPSSLLQGGPEEPFDGLWVFMCGTASPLPPPRWA